MQGLSVVFLILAVVAAVFGFYLSAASTGLIAKPLFFLFLGLTFVSFIFSRPRVVG